MQTLREKYNKEVVPAMMKEFGYKNKMAVPTIKKIVLNTSFGKTTSGKSGSEREKFRVLSYPIWL
jgi:large subunit ribosomal protein L5